MLIEYEQNDPEVFSYAEDILKIFRAAGVTKVSAMPLTHMVPMPGLFVQISPSLKDFGIEAIFAAANFPVAVFVKDISSERLPKGPPPPNIFIWVGGKPPVSFDSTGGDNP